MASEGELNDYFELIMQLVDEAGKVSAILIPDSHISGVA